MTLAGETSQWTMPSGRPVPSVELAVGDGTQVVHLLEHQVGALHQFVAGRRFKLLGFGEVGERFDEFPGFLERNDHVGTAQKTLEPAGQIAATFQEGDVALGDLHAAHAGHVFVEDDDVEFGLV